MAHVLLSDAIACYRGHWGMVLAGVMARQEARPSLVEGTALLPA